MKMMSFNTRQIHQELICMITLTVVIWSCCIIVPTTMAASGLLQPALNFHYQPPEQKMDQGTTTTTTTTTTTLTVDDTNVSFLFKVKVYPFRRKVLAALTARNKEMRSHRFGGSQTGVVKRPTTNGDTNNNGVVAFGVDLGLPGSLGGMGYGHQIPFSIPFDTLSISSVQVRTESHMANDIIDDRNEY